MSSVYIRNKFLTLLIVWTVTTSIQAEYSPKSDVEDVPGLIFPIAPNSICMRRPYYQCKWTYEKSCSCNPVKPKKLKRRIDVTYIRKKLKKKHIAPKDQESYECLRDRCIQMY
ncbi:uncharacterized protein LOC131671407 [Phymastichus coffea]|uniref:uncharacterized protein LOC131671407 n=1 Tax=Phymastichus coffea TaxID=108790 RepID=UPI00273BC0D5|nr:uncharacterized protein LOC131671407 [Phymastichus coffea]